MRTITLNEIRDDEEIDEIVTELARATEASDLPRIKRALAKAKAAKARHVAHLEAMIGREATNQFLSTLSVKVKPQ